jgi:putative ABC transport system permease protein
MNLDSLVNLFEIAVLVGLLYSFFTIGLSISFRVLNYPDLTLEGSVILGGAVSFNVLKAGYDPFTALLAGLLFGSLAGMFTAVQYLYFKVSKLLSGIITTAILYSINIRLLGGRANARFDDVKTLFDVVNPSRSQAGDLLLLAALVAAIVLFFALLFNTKLGYLLRTLGDNSSFLVSLGSAPGRLTVIGLAIANAVAGAGGAILVQYKNTCDVNMSFGLLTGALAAMIIGESFLAARKMWQYLISGVLGTIAYNLAVGLVLFSWSSEYEKLVMASDVRLLTGLLLILPTVIKMSREGKFILFKSDW